MRNQPAAIEGKMSRPVMRSIVLSQEAPEIWELSSSETCTCDMAETTVRMPIMRYLMR